MRVPVCKVKDYLHVDDLRFHPENPRSIRPERLRDLKDSIIKKGFYQPILVWTKGNVVLAGNHRLLAVRQLIKEKHDFGPGGKNMLPVVFEKCDEERASQILFESNNTYAEWIEARLREALEDTDDIKAMGFTDEYVEGLLKSAVEDAEKATHFIDPDDYSEEPLPEPDAEKDNEVPPLPTETRVRKGDIFALGEHRLLCGDSTVKSDVAALMADHRADLVFTDPPYGVSYIGKTKDALTIENDTLDDEDLLKFLKAAFAVWPLKEGGSFYVCSPAGYTELVFRKALGQDVRQCICWVKDIFVMGRQDYHWRHESILYGWVKGAAHFFVDDRTQDTVWNCPRPRASKEHPTMKPIELVERAIRNSSRTHDIVFDGFSGSGSTLIACEKSQRRSFGIELDPFYAAVILTRWEKFTGKKAFRLTSKGEVPWQEKRR